MRKPWAQKLLVFLIFYGGLALLIGSGSKTLDLLFIAVSFGWMLVRSAALLTYLRIHESPNGQRSFRLKRLPAPVERWHRWILGETEVSPAGR